MSCNTDWSSGNLQAAGFPESNIVKGHLSTNLEIFRMEEAWYVESLSSLRKKP